VAPVFRLGQVGKGEDASKHTLPSVQDPGPPSGSFLLCYPLRFSFGCLRNPFSISYSLISEPNTLVHFTPIFILRKNYTELISTLHIMFCNKLLWTCNGHTGKYGEGKVKVFLKAQQYRWAIGSPTFKSSLTTFFFTGRL
jgi:hypothetical protein